MSQVWIKEFREKLIEAELSEDQCNIQKCIEYKIRNLPNFIYKYRSFSSEFAFEDLRNNSVHLSFAHEFNDPFDCVSILSYEQFILIALIENDKELFFNQYSDVVRNEMIQRIKSGEKLLNIIDDMFLPYPSDRKYHSKLLNKAKKELDDIVTSIGEDFKTKFLLCCFSATLNNNLMWSHYSKSHTGFCIEYDISKLPEDSPFKHSLYPIIYTKNPILAKLQRQNYTDCTKDMFTLLNKSLDWRYENEFRMLCPPSFKSSYIMPVEPSCLYLGSKISNSNENAIIKFANKKGINVKKMRLKSNSFNLESYQI